MPCSDYLAKARLNWETGTTYPAAVTDCYFRLYTANPDGSDASGTELTGTGYTPQHYTGGWSSPTQPGGAGTPWQQSNSALISFGNAASDWTGPITAIARYSASSGGHMYGYRVLPSPLSFVTGEVIQIPVGSYVIEES